MAQYVTVRQRKFGQWRTLTVMLVLCVAQTLCCPSQKACAGEPAPATTRAVAGANETPSLALLDVLDKAWPRRRRGEWTTWVMDKMEDLSTTRTPGKVCNFSLAERDRIVANLGDAFLKTCPNTKARCLIMEHIDEYPGARHRYRRLIMFLPIGVNRQILEDLQKHNAIELKEENWAKMETWINASIRNGGGNHGLGEVMDTDDTTVISFYDGHRWHVATWMSFERYLTELQDPSGRLGKPPPKYPVPSAEVIAFGNLLNFLDTFPEVPERFAPERYDYLKQYIEYLP